MSDDVDSTPEGSDGEYSLDSDDQLQPGDTLDDRGVEDILDEGYSPPEKPSKAMRYGVTAEDQREGESLDEHLAEEEPDPAAQINLHDDPPAPDPDGVPDDIDEYDNEVGDERSGRLLAPDEGVDAHLSSQETAEDVGFDGAAASAEEAAVHVVPDERA
ncbi:DUF5709 domain-containing protein [Williamsia sp.]|uniref:DUF5709 domain-containing protein n=1 Tax=Williamsia sp. TaxID=1872085 RepID=UPI001A1EC6BC|nr:DUF5709 domain-containing protein [Williamsia sp.]MBJ7288708.1 hypothetical protein [Williamsia sp.]